MRSLEENEAETRALKAKMEALHEERIRIKGQLFRESMHPEWSSRLLEAAERVLDAFAGDRNDYGLGTQDTVPVSDHCELAIFARSRAAEKDRSVERQR